MSMKTSSWIAFLFFVVSLWIIPSSYSQDQLSSSSSHEDEQLKTFIVFVSKSDEPSVFNSHLDWHTAALQSLPPSPISVSSSSTDPYGSASREIIYSYDHVAHGFAARLTTSQASHLRSLPGIVSIIPERFRKPRTTRSPQFLGLNDGFGLWPNSGDGQVFPGVSLYYGDAIPNKTYLEIVHFQSSHGFAEMEAGGVGMILIQYTDLLEALDASSYPIPATAVTNDSGLKILTYINNNILEDKKPTATIHFIGPVTGTSSSSAPKVSDGSSTGPNPVTPEILKPDIIAPGVNILAARSGSDAELVMKSGTSMACPHVSGLAALLRSAFPKWSPAAIKSALMTTAYTVDNSGKPKQSSKPGLVHDIAPSGYEAFLCTIGYSDEQMKLFVKDREVVCDSVGLSSADAIYNLKIRSRTPYVKISVSPTKLVFSKDITILPYEVAFESRPTHVSEAFGSIEWYDGEHVVRSPIAFVWGSSSSNTSTSLISSV
ncbi:hypothetical protein C5167_026583 [Papaver somniferum]|nr:hypothetical protein C5167_026583 [Papaver somniferum]